MATTNLAHHIQLASLVNQTTSVFFIDQKTVAFIPMGQHVLLLDSYCHGQSSAYIAMAPNSRIWKLMEWYKALTAFHIVWEQQLTTAQQDTSHRE